jgi:hypothetical protein
MAYRMKTHLSFNGYLIKWKWHNKAPKDAVFECAGKLVNPKGSYVNALYVAVCHSQTCGYGYL